MTTMTLTELAAYFAGAAELIGLAEHHALDESGTLIQHAARELIGHENAGWPALADSTIAEKSRLGFTGQVSSTDPLLRTGALRDSIQFVVHGHTSVEIGSDSPYADAQEHGTSRGIPPRPFLGAALIQNLHHCGDLIGHAVAGAIGGEAPSTGIGTPPSP